jgi:glycosyltransferase involved in cell wall biosynthesis
VISTYQPSSLLQTAVRSVVNQLIKPVEIILIDDSSQSINLTEIQDLIPADVKFIFHRNSENLGAGGSRNVGVNLSSTDYLLFFDDDDYSLPERSTIHWDAFQKGAGVSYVSSRKNYPNGYTVIFQNMEIPPSLISPSIFAQKLLYGRPIPGSIGEIPSSTLAIAKEDFLRVKGFDDSIRRLEDVDLALRLSLAEASFSWSSNVLVERTATFRKDKGGQIETNHEYIILEKYGYLLGWWREKYSRALIDLRSIYFGGLRIPVDFLLLKRCLNPFCAFVIITKFFRFTARLNHDRKQGAK